MASKLRTPQDLSRKRSRDDFQSAPGSPTTARKKPLTTRREILFYGDSLTFGMHHAKASRYGQTWPQLLEERLHNQNYRAIESALCSRTTAHDDPWEKNDEWMPGSEGSDFNGLRHFGPLFSSHTPSVLVIALGTNDLKTRIRKPPFLSWLMGRRTALDEARAIAESCARIGEKARLLYSGFCHSDAELVILILTPPHLVLTDTSREMGYDKYSEEISHEFPQAFADMCKEHKFLNIATTPPSMEKSNDGVHFTQAAQATLAENVWDDLEILIQESKPATRAARMLETQQKSSSSTKKVGGSSSLLVPSKVRRASISARKRKQPSLYFASPARRGKELR